ncbi:MAG: phenylalanine--tRNA ligase subunit alpha [Chloroflexi bacterium]|nr:phenylalanine--tRNA ligase subunit alpha [Chloroflexota bacterium]
MIDQLAEIKARALKDLAAADDAEATEAWRVAYLGKKGQLTTVLRQLGALPPAERPLVGQKANEVKVALELALAARLEVERRVALRRAAEAERVDVTLPGRQPSLGQVHPTTRVLKEVLDSFAAMGFQVAEGPDVEWDYYNFEALNIPKDHPARDMWDTFYVQSKGRPGEILLRTHTSPNQVRVMEKVRPPVRVVVPGRVYRYEATDATHESEFFQVEGLAVDKNVTMADLKGVLSAFAREMFGAERKVRFRCDYFPFVEPGVEMAISCFQCGGVGCRLCGNGWLEIMGAGMVHPKVLAGVGYDPSVYSGFAFGIGVERIAILKYGIDDIRLFYANDLRFLRQFK